MYVCNCILYVTYTCMYDPYPSVDIYICMSIYLSVSVYLSVCGYVVASALMYDYT